MYEYLGYAPFALIPGFLLLDFVRADRRYRKPRFWRTRATLVTAAIVVLTGFVALGWSTLLTGIYVFDLGHLAPLPGAAVGVLTYECFHYCYHRLAHRWEWLWRAGHQMHHSAESLDAFGAYFLHPFDAAMFTSWQSLVFFPLLGLAPEAGIIAALFLTFNAMFQHANVSTPRWLGFLIQRPESHVIHHGRGIHRYNYANLPLLDMLFGTFRNPRCVDGQAVGFYDGASSRLGAMLIGRDVSTPVAPKPTDAGPAGWLSAGPVSRTVRP